MVVQLIIAVIAFALVGPFWEVRKGGKEERESALVEAEEVEESVVKRSGEMVADTGNAVVNSPENEKGA